MSNAMVHRYEIWKVRCVEVLKVERPIEELGVMKEVAELSGRAMDVSAGDRALFAKRNVPKPGGDAVQMKEWVRAVRGSIKRREKIEQLNQRDLRTYFGRG